MAKKKKKKGPNMAELTLKVEEAKRRQVQLNEETAKKESDILQLDREILTYKMKLKNTEMLQVHKPSRRLDFDIALGMWYHFRSPG